MTDVAVDLDLLRAVRDVRTAKGACTLRDIGEALGLTIGGVQHRVDKALGLGHLEKSEVAGSLRVAAGVGHQLRLTVGGNGEPHDVVIIVDEHDEPLDVRLVKLGRRGPAPTLQTI